MLAATVAHTDGQTLLILKYKIQKVFQENVKDSADRSKIFCDRNSKEPEIEVGTKVLLHSTVLKTGNPLDFTRIGLAHTWWYLNMTTDYCIDSVIALQARSLEPRYTQSD